MEVEDNASSKTCRMSKEESKENLDQDLGSEVNVEPEISSIERPTLTIILSLCGLLQRKCWQKSKRIKSLKFQHEYIVLRPGCIEFLRDLLRNFNVGIWSATKDTHVMEIIKILEKKAKEEFPFFMIYGQIQCQRCVVARITCPNKPKVEALFKPLAIASTQSGIDLKLMLLIDDTPLKGCVNLASNCIFPPSFNVDKEDNVLIGQLLPYIKSLHHSNNIPTIVSSSLYGQAPIVLGHELYSFVHIAVSQWEERNLLCLEKRYSTSKLPKFPQPLDGEKVVTTSTSGMFTRSQDKKLLTLDREKFRVLKSIKSLSTLKGVEAIMLAQKLGYKEPVIRVHEAKNYIKQLKLQFNLK